jgi:hypothetical protein
VGAGTAAMKAPGPQGPCVRRAFVTASLSLLIARHEGGRGPRGVPVGGGGGASDATHSRVAVAGQAPAAAVQSSAGRPLVRTRWLVILPSSASAASAWSSWWWWGCGAAGLGVGCGSVRRAAGG